MSFSPLRESVHTQNESDEAREKLFQGDERGRNERKSEELDKCDLDLMCGISSFIFFMSEVTMLNFSFAFVIESVDRSEQRVCRGRDFSYVTKNVTGVTEGDMSETGLRVVLCHVPRFQVKLNMWVYGSHRCGRDSADTELK